ncbi:MAG: ABC transporter permease [Acidimicrobiales bacterium]
MDGISSWFDFVQQRRDDIVTLTLEHFQLVASVIVVATVLSVSLGVAVRNHPTAKSIAIGTAGIFLTIPSLALFTIFIPIVGLGFWPSFIALLMYAILPILRNTVTGLDEVDPAVIESARGMGLNARQRLFDVQLPLAWPVIMTGIRVSALLTTGIAAIATLVGYGGLGEFIKNGLRRLGLPNSLEEVWTGVVFTIVLALLIDLAFSLIQRFTTSKGLR